MRDNLRKQNYLSRADFREHVELIVANSRLYNGADSSLTQTAMQMMEYTNDQFKVWPSLLLTILPSYQAAHRFLIALLG